MQTTDALAEYEAAARAADLFSRDPDDAPEHEAAVALRDRLWWELTAEQRVEVGEAVGEGVGVR